MKMVLAIVQDKDANKLGSVFVKHNIQATRTATSGGFLRSGNTTFMIGIEDERVPEVLELIKETAHARKQFMTPAASLDLSLEATSSMPMEVQIGGATVFIQDVEQFHQF
ncbi:cyclic-di-AMP receptor [Weissella diestrammenae]|uniref:Cyclic-di-AMP receptor n=1 Tax=Weissella diestrammenae TaxID=1162633 RepID=A0A7G9T3J1_9LACO|nr:cyclic-di-AMP receptor [Weissella diestrammenae]MCM0582637.1 cyclic-di-AMP receptor [Weissella diestrammenae]QNN74666.1 cyclic-di-AMP receptor [Weissella diestrammenae]